MSCFGQGKTMGHRAIGTRFHHRFPHLGLLEANTSKQEGLRKYRVETRIASAEPINKAGSSVFFIDYHF